jgi:hypothetical protein
MRMSASVARGSRAGSSRIRRSINVLMCTKHVCNTARLQHAQRELLILKSIGCDFGAFA